MGEPFVWQAIQLSCKVAVLAVINVVLLGVPIAKFMSRHQFSGKSLLESVFTLPIVLPPSVVGFALVLLLGKHGPLGWLMQKLGAHSLLFTASAAVIASTVVAFPLFYQSVKAAFEGVDTRYEQAARTLGAGETRVFFTITLPLAWPGVLAGLVMSFARALGEFGATLMLAGNIPGVTQTVPLAIYFSAESGDYQTAFILVAIISCASLLVMVWLNHWSRHGMTKWQERRREAHA